MPKISKPKKYWKIISKLTKLVQNNETIKSFFKFNNLFEKSMSIIITKRINRIS